MKYKLSLPFSPMQEQILDCISDFKTKGNLFGDGKRNVIKLFELDGLTMNIKSFKVPNLFNRIVYSSVRKSKARRSFEYATLLLEKGIGTPRPIAFVEKYDLLGLRDSYYASEHLQYDLTYRELVEIPSYPDHETILRQFTRFSYELHQKGIEFKDHSPGNTLIKKTDSGEYNFFLVDLNRMRFHQEMSFDQRLWNLRRLTPEREMVRVMSNEYAKLSGESETLIFERLWRYTSDFQEKFHKKKRLKKKLKFWERLP